MSRRLLFGLAKDWGRRGFAQDAKGEVTALYDFHLDNGGKIVNFGGYLLPVQYQDQSIVNSHLFTRKNASIFDVSHMLQTEITGAGCVDFIESVVTADVRGLLNNAASLTVFTDEKGGILDDLIVTKIQEDHLYVVSNAAMKKQDQAHLLKALEEHKKKNPQSNIKIQFYEPLQRGLIALQGPKAAQALQKLMETDLSSLYFMNTTTGTVANVNCRITRCGYTGEDGFEISYPAHEGPKIVAELLQNPDVKLAGLGARDSLRLEAGLCLYGNDITRETTPVEGALTWLIAKRRRELADFPGAQTILQQIKDGVTRKRVGIISTAGPPARHGATIVDQKGATIGQVTSGCPAPSLGKNVAMGYVQTESSKIGTEVNLKIRDKLYPGVVSKMPFVKVNYYNKPK